MSQANFEMSEPLVEASQEPVDLVALGYIERVQTAVSLYDINPYVVDQAPTQESLSMVIGYIRPPEQRPRGREDFNSEDVQNYFNAFESFAVRINQDTNKLEPIAHEDVMGCTQAIWDWMHEATIALSAMQQREPVAAKNTKIANWVLGRVSKLVTAHKVAFEPTE